MLIDVANPGDRNMIKKEAEKILKYKDLIIKIQHLWNVKTQVILVIMGVTGTISNSLRQYLSNIPGKNKIKAVHKTAILDTAHILQIELMYKYKTYFTGEVTSVMSPPPWLFFSHEH